MALKITGIPELLASFSPLPPSPEDPCGRKTIVRKLIGAASTGFGGDDEFVTRTTIG
jgi:hypothetical protein